MFTPGNVSCFGNNPIDILKMQISHSELLAQPDFDGESPVGGPRLVPRLPAATDPRENLPAGTAVDAGRLAAAQLRERVEEQLRESVAETVEFDPQRSLGVQHQVPAHVPVGPGVPLRHDLARDVEQADGRREPIDELLLQGLRVSDHG